MGYILDTSAPPQHTILRGRVYADTLNPQLSKSERVSAPSPGYTMQG